MEQTGSAPAAPATRSPDLKASFGLQRDEDLATLLQEQENAFLSLARSFAGAQPHDEAGTEGDETPGTPSSEQEGEVGEEDDEEMARRLQGEEQQAMYQRLMDLSGFTVQYEDDPMDPDEMTYEELQALGDCVGSVSRGLSAEARAGVAEEVLYRQLHGCKRAHVDQSSAADNDASTCCVICRYDFQDDEVVQVLGCKHVYHTECLQGWLNVNKVCPMCNCEVKKLQGNKEAQPAAKPKPAC